MNKNEVLNYSAAIVSYSSGENEKQQTFYKELKALLRKYSANLELEAEMDSWRSYHIENIIITFNNRED